MGGPWSAEAKSRYKRPENSGRKPLSREEREARGLTTGNWKQQHPEEHAAHAREYRLRNREKIKAQNAVNVALRRGSLVDGTPFARQPCELCETTENVNAHHKSYAPEDWYNVRWLCHLCHTEIHLLEGRVKKREYRRRESKRRGPSSPFSRIRSRQGATRSE